MARRIRTLMLSGLILGCATSCGEKQDEEDDGDDPRPQAPVINTDAGTTPEPAPACESIAGLVDESCEVEEREAQPRGAQVLLVMDKSRSMIQQPAGYTMNKWEALRMALATALDRVKGFINLGLEFFPTSGDINNPLPVDCGDRCCELPGGNNMNINIGPGIETVPLISQTLLHSEPAGGTPTSGALARAYEYFTIGAGAGVPGERYVLLATDGGPNCNPSLSCTVETCTWNIDNSQGCVPGGENCCAPRPLGCLDADLATQFIQGLAGIGVRTIVVGIPGTEMYSEVLDVMGAAGGFEKADGSTGYYQVSAEGGVDELIATFQEITTQLVTDCVVDLGGQIPNPNVVNVAVNCVLIPMETDPDMTVGRWRFDDPANPTAIIIDGPLCETIQTEGVGRIDVILGCPTQTLG